MPSKEHQQKEIHVTEPIFSVATILQVSGIQLHLSLCVLPGLDPHLEIAKTCQDTCIYINDENSLLMALFDGHGKYGEQVVEFCSKQINELYYLLKDKHVVLVR
jgi:hypothetical protein